MPPDGVPGGVPGGIPGGTPDGNAGDLIVSGTPATARPDRPRVIAFVCTQETETALREGLVEAMPGGFEIHRGNVRAAMTALRKMPIPHTLIIDVSGESQPLSALSELSEVVVPDVRVLVIGDRDDLNFYRQVTRGLGVQEYLYQPLMRDMVARYFGPLLQHGMATYEGVQGGRVVTVTGTRGGTGASTIAANLAWHFGVEAGRHTVLLDADLHRGITAMLLGVKTGPGLRTALEAPDRIDELFVERAALPVSKRLHVLAGEESLTDAINVSAQAAARLLGALRRRYNFIVVDVPCSSLPFHRDLLMLAHQRVLVMDPTLASVRDTLRLMALPNGPEQPRRGVLVLNRETLPGGLNRRELEEGLKMKPDVVIPDLPKVVGHAASMGEPAMAGRGGFRTGMMLLAREVAFERLLDLGVPGSASTSTRGGLLRRVLGLKS
jgi:pilus assembly protein CpaE